MSDKYQLRNGNPLSCPVCQCETWWKKTAIITIEKEIGSYYTHIIKEDHAIKSLECTECSNVLFFDSITKVPH